MFSSFIIWIIATKKLKHLIIKQKKTNQQEKCYPHMTKNMFLSTRLAYICNSHNQLFNLKK